MSDTLADELTHVMGHGKADLRQVSQSFERLKAFHSLPAGMNEAAAKTAMTVQAVADSLAAKYRSSGRTKGNSHIDLQGRDPGVAPGDAPGCT